MTLLKLKTVNVDGHTHNELKKLSKAYKNSIGEFIRYGVIYFKKTGINPQESAEENPQKAIKELTRRVEQIIGVIKSQEQDKINPLLESIMMLVRRTELLLSDAPKESTFKTVLTRTEEMIEADQKHHYEQLTTQHKYYKGQAENQQQTNQSAAKKLDELLAGLDKMTALLTGLKGK